jgi:hypothetical protein
VPAAAAMKELLAAGTEPGHDVLEIGHGRRGAAEHGGIQRAAPSGEQAKHDEAAADLEAPVGNVLVRYAVAGHVEGRPEQQGERPGADERTGSPSDRDMERDDHPRMIAYAPAMSLGDWLRRLFSPSDPEADVKAAAEGAKTSAGGFGPGIPGTPAAAEAAEAEIESEEPPLDPDP